MIQSSVLTHELDAQVICGAAIPEGAAALAEAARRRKGGGREEGERNEKKLALQMSAPTSICVAVNLPCDIEMLFGRIRSPVT